MKLRLLAAATAAFVLTSGAVLAQTAAPAAAPNDKATLSYALGYQMASGMASRKVDLDVSAIVRGVQDGYAKKDPSISFEKLEASLDAFQDKLAADYKRMADSNKAKSDSLLASNRAKAGVTVLPNGVQYRTITKGTGVKPTAASTITLHMKGSLPDGTVTLDTTRGGPNQAAPASPTPASIQLSGLNPPALRETILLMPAGSHWEIIIPSDKAFGANERPVGPNQALIFDVNLVSIK